MLSELRKSVHSSANLEAAWRVIHRNGRYSKSDDVRTAIETFAMDPARNLRSLQARLSRGRFDFGKARGAPIAKRDSKGRPTGKIRPIVVASLEARIVQRAILNKLIEFPGLAPYINTPYSFGGIRKSRSQIDGLDESLSAVPAAIGAVLNEIENGARWVAAADITGFFTKISKTTVTRLVGRVINDADFMELFERAIIVELENLNALRDLAGQFPIEDIGVAQGNSLSPLLGNVLLSKFDLIMNEGDCRCIRYIDDFIILAPTRRAADARLRKAISLLSQFDMVLSPEKSSKRASNISDSFEFLGIEISPGFVRPTKKSRSKFLNSIADQIEQSVAEMAGLRHGNAIDPRFSFVSTLKRIDGMVDGWGKHYWFCNDRQLFNSIDEKIRLAIGDYFGAYSDIRSRLPSAQKHAPLGLTALGEMDRTPFNYPKLSGEKLQTKAETCRH